MEVGIMGHYWEYLGLGFPITSKVLIRSKELEMIFKPFTVGLERTSQYFTFG